ncbi:unnamed protein product [Echinostoma caproni]|uniref:Mannosyltransferase n=1 Tax=Echinostoma caproni TaxID=27848 RepID=A0A183AU33_9TREM|nr:unnamed protein product [Echinostoma caproni]
MYPAASLPLLPSKRKTTPRGLPKMDQEDRNHTSKMVIINLQKTKLAKRAWLNIHAKADVVLSMLLSRLMMRTHTEVKADPQSFSPVIVLRSNHSDPAVTPPWRVLPHPTAGENVRIIERWSDTKVDFKPSESYYNRLHCHDRDGDIPEYAEDQPKCKREKVENSPIPNESSCNDDLFNLSIAQQLFVSSEVNHSFHQPMQKPWTSYQPQFLGWAVYAVLLGLRFMLVLATQSGYLHPDEFFQSVEIGAGDVYGLDVIRSWEFVLSDKGPLRSIAGLGPLVHFPLWISKQFFPSTQVNANGTGFASLSGAELFTRVLLPVRLQTVLCSFVVDVFILVGSGYIRRPYSRGRRCFLNMAPPIALLLYSSGAFGGLLLAGRTLANTWEMASVAAFAILALFVIRDVHPRSSLILITFILCIQAVLFVWATFVRCTYPVFVFPLALKEIYVLLCRFKHRILLSGSMAALLAACTIQLCLHVDTVYFTQSDPFTWHSVTDLICVPCRFLKYNSRSEHLSEHGLHPPYLHLLVNMPLIFGPVLGFLSLLIPSPIRSGQTLLWLSIVVPLAFLSSIPHQEARFLLPIVPFVLILTGRRLEQFMDGAISRKRIIIVCIILASWCVQQICLTVVFGSLHQAGVISYLKSIPTLQLDPRECPVHVFYHTYMPPRFVLGRPVSLGSEHSPCHNVIDLSGSHFKRLEDTLAKLRLQADREANKQWIAYVVSCSFISGGVCACHHCCLLYRFNGLLK